MPASTRSSDITSLSHFRAKLRDHLSQRHSTKRPLFVTSNGRTEAVVLAPAQYDELLQRADLAASLHQLDQSQKDIQAGRTMPAKSAIRSIAKAFDLKLRK